MGNLIAAMATSHAFAVMNPAKWDDFLKLNRGLYQKLYGVEPQLAPESAQETLETNLARYQRISEAHDRLKKELQELRPDVLLVVGDDQNEHFKADNIPQIAMYSGGDFRTAADAPAYRSRSDVADLLLKRLVREDFDVSIVGKFPDDRLISHAHVHVLERLVPDRDIPVVPIFVNGIHVPSLEPRRCYALGAAMRRIVASDLPSETRVAVVASGGLSHFTAGYPWKAYNGPFKYGAISTDFDQRLIAAMTRGGGAKLASELTSDDLLYHGDIEFRCWLVVLGMVEDVPAEMLAYEPFYRAIMGMGVGRWPLA
jgi:aromatic ring-opening dioxygenase catalytic subunit (LigB family)